MVLSKAQGEQTFKWLKQAIYRALCTEWCGVPWMGQRYSWFNPRIATISAKCMLNHGFPEGRVTWNLPISLETAFALLLPHFSAKRLCSLLFVHSRQGWDNQGCPKIIRDAAGQWLSSSSSLPMTLTSLSAISMYWSWGGTLQTTLRGRVNLCIKIFLSYLWSLQ